MRDPLLRSPFGKTSCENSPGDSWLYRVRENLAQLLLPSHFTPSSANGAPIHLLKFDKSLRPARAQGVSVLTHIATFAAVIFLVLRVPPPPVPLSPHGPTIISNYRFPVIRTVARLDTSDGGSRGGGRDPVLATHGAPPPRAPIPIVKPTIPQTPAAILPEPPSILDPNAPNSATAAEKLGLDWMRKDTNSPGSGNGHGIGPDNGNGVGENGAGWYGDGKGNVGYGLGFIPPMCSYCPYPTYSDDARHGKVQGSVTLQVLVGTDGRAQSIRIVQGIGFGLDERAVETVRGWKFIPARDEAKRPVPSWVTVEATFRLF
jgi:protein TonB